MPGMDGLQLVGEIKQRFSDLPVMTVTAYGDEERLQQAAEYGAAEFLAKPVDCECLSARLPQLPSAWDAETGVDRMTAYSLPLIDPRTRAKVAFGAL
jgi:CheY-like chemotaxis protein